MKTRPWLKQRWILAIVAAAVIVADRIAALLSGTDGFLPAFGSEGIALAWAIGHCDGMDGPVVTLARKALDDRNVNLVLPWVRAEDEGEVRAAFEHALAVRGLGPEAKRLADLHFFETLVRVHRAGEGAAYTGLKPAGRDLGPAIPAADRALDDGSIEKVITLITQAIRSGIREHYRAAADRKKFDVNDVRAGRAYVAAYVPYVHYVERLWQDATGEALGHHAETSPSEHAAHAHEHARHAH